MDVQASPKQSDSVFKRLLILYGLYTLISNAMFLVGYYLLPEGFMRGSPQVQAAGAIAAAGSFWSEFGLTLLTNLLWFGGLVIVLNLNQVKGFPLGYIMILPLALISGLVLGTNSFAASDLRQYNAWEGTALGMSIGGIETLGLVLIIASTVAFGLYQYRSWWRWSGQWAPSKIKRFRDIRLTQAEWLCLIAGILLLVLAAYRETAMRWSA